MRSVFRLRTFAIVFVVALTACSPAAAPTPTELPASTAAPSTVTGAPTITAAPTSINTSVPRPTKKPGFKLLPLPPATIKDKVEVNGHKSVCGLLWAGQSHYSAGARVWYRHLNLELHHSLSGFGDAGLRLRSL